MSALHKKIPTYRQKILSFFIILALAFNLSITMPSHAKTKANHKKQTTEETKKTQENEDSIASLQQPTIEELSNANQELLTQNAKLQREVNELETQVNVLMAERSGQLFLYGAMTVVMGGIVGVFVAWLMSKRRKRW